MNKFIQSAILALGLMSGLVACTHVPQVNERGRIYDRNGVLLVDNAEGKKGRSQRSYPSAIAATHVLGLVDAEGKGESGVEYHYDKVLREGMDLHLTIDAELQKFVEGMMADKVGALVAIEPETGEILCMVSAPFFDPSMMSGDKRGESFLTLNANPNKPFFNRAVNGHYSSGSTFKPAMALACLQDSIITPETRFPCNYGFVKDGWRMGCHDGAHAEWTLMNAQATSCNGYFGWCMDAFMHSERYKDQNVALDRLHELVLSMGIGCGLDSDMGGIDGHFPNSEYMRSLYGTSDWNPRHTASESIGQGSIIATPLQMANLAAIIANRGYYRIPHVVGRVGEDSLSGESKYRQEIRTLIDSSHYETVIMGMRRATTNGSAYSTGNLDEEGILMCGATGTVQNPHGKDHSAFMAFAPMNNPRIAVFCIVEHGGFGATVAVPTVARTIWKYLNVTISDKSEMMAVKDSLNKDDENLFW